MKVPLHFRCDRCGCENYIFVNLDQSSFETKCRCGDVIPSFFGSNVTLGYKVLWRSNYELLERQDYPLSIVLSAMAFDCELTRLHSKWNQIGALGLGIHVSDEELEALLRKYRTIDRKIEEAAKLMDPRGFAGFADGSPEFRAIVSEGFPSLSLESLSKDFQAALFWPRNRVLHLGDASFSLDDAKRCFNIATLGLRILEAMDERRRSGG
ncbi:MAG: hypothetical protein JSW27_17885 [Phycisphaerales bacterium]|nr:MAG: hypothetical protein JSW27_17885 [Phycisphaerales bacterium]